MRSVIQIVAPTWALIARQQGQAGQGGGRRFMRGSSACAVILFVGLGLAGCGPQLYLVRPETTRTVTVAAPDQGDAFSKAMRAAAESGMAIYFPNKDAGTFYASKGGGFVEFSDINYLIHHASTPGQFIVILKAKSSRGADTILDEFLSAYGKYVRIITP